MYVIEYILPKIKVNNLLQLPLFWEVRFPQEFGSSLQGLLYVAVWLPICVSVHPKAIG